jgi:hypothetical protein
MRVMMVSTRSIIAAGLIALAAAGCKPVESPPDVLKSQRKALTNARAVEGQLLQQAEEQRKAADEAQK